MSEKSLDVPGEDDAQALNERMKSGGGCAEAWEAAQEMRDEKKKSSNRRQLLTGIGASLLFGTSLTKTVSAQTVSESKKPDVEVEELSDEERTGAVKKALSDPQVEKIESNLRDRGMKQDRESAVAQRASGEEGSKLTVRIPYKIPNDLSEGVEKYAGIIWSSWNDGLTHGFVSKRELKPGTPLSPDVKEAFEESNVNYESADTVSTEVSYTTIGSTEVEYTSSKKKKKATFSHSGSVSENTESLVVPVEKSSSEEASQEGIADCLCTASFGTSPITACAPCGTVKPDCIGQIVSNLGAELGACAGCGAAAVITSGGAVAAACLPCLGAIAESFGSGEINSLCCWCNFGGEFV
ncbi:MULTISPECIES: hypothetical protein [Halorubrum]|uniref:Uncharacterized protein n=1 Tax=Halorubrum hochstenium ATCC 700873 TaxID=1227481 RepID=M0F9Z4_9EURY|nr:MULTISPECIES: hypothetical protein [Halorubrum]ELZ56775.1 hypothetical protein C467_07877 [Halorubrum hochstenium ATCC 700873]